MKHEANSATELARTASRRRNPGTSATRGLITLALLVVTAACGDSEPTGPDGTPTRVHIRVSEAAVTVPSLGEEFSLGIRVEDEAGTELSGVELEWGGDVGQVVEHVGADLFRSLANGTAAVEVSLSEGQNLTLVGDAPTVEVTVAQEPRALTMTPAAETPADPEEGPPVVRLWSLGQETELGVWTVDENGYPVERVSSGVVFGSESDEIGRVSEAGRVLAMSEGSTWIRAESGSFAGTVELIVDASLELSACASFTAGEGQAGSAGQCGLGGLLFTES